MGQVAGLEHRNADLGDVRLHYVVAGSGDPGLLLHGWPQTWYCWRKVIPALAQRYLIIAPDLRGLGDSSRQASGYDNAPSPTTSTGLSQVSWATTGSIWPAFAGYWEGGAVTRSGLTDDGWFRTGDLGALDADGYLSILGRSMDLIITGGFNVYPCEVEEVLAAHDDVEECAVFGVPDDDLVERVIAVVLVRNGSTASGDSVRAWARERMTGYKAPRAVVIRRQLPRTALGKVEKERLRESLTELPS